MAKSNGFFADQVEALERRLITEALEKAHGNVSQASRALEMSRRTLWNKLEDYSINVSPLRTTCPGEARLRATWRGWTQAHVHPAARVVLLSNGIKLWMGGWPLV